MSGESSDAEPGLLRSAYRTVTPSYRPHPDAEMNAVGWAMFVGLIFLLLPLLPVLVAVWLVAKLFERLASRTAE